MEGFGDLEEFGGIGELGDWGIGDWGIVRFEDCGIGAYGVRGLGH